MKASSNGNGHPEITDALVTRALNLAAQDAIELHRRWGLPMAVSRNGKVELISPPPARPKKKRAKRRTAKVKVKSR